MLEGLLGAAGIGAELLGGSSASNTIGKAGSAAQGTIAAAVRAGQQGVENGMQWSNASYQGGRTALDNSMGRGATYLNNAAMQSTAALAPQILAGDNALQAYQNALGIATPQGGYGQVGDLTNQIAALQASINSYNTELSIPEGTPGGHAIQQQRVNDMQTQMAGLQQQLATAKQPTQADSGAILNQLRNTPGYQFTQQQGLSALDNQQASQGLLRSGNTQALAEQYATGLADNTYQNYVGNLATASNNLNPYATQQGQVYQNQGNQLANNQQWYGTQTNLNDMTQAQGLLQAGETIGSMALNGGLAEANVGMSSAAGQAGIQGGLGQSIGSGLLGLAGQLFGGGGGGLF